MTKDCLSKLFILCVLGMHMFLPLNTQAEEVFSARLENGLRVIIKPQHYAPVVTTQIWYRVGSADEYRGVTGVSHLLEHMMFKGTPKHPSGDFARIVAELGGEMNAFTSRDYTAYFETLPKQHLKVSLEFEADRMQNLLLDEAEFRAELDVVKEERRLRTDDNPHAFTQEQANAVAFTNSAYRNPVIGWEEDLRDLTLDDLRQWYRRYYVPSNATVVIVGDVDTKDAFALVQEYFGALVASHSSPPIVYEADAFQIGERRVLVKRPAKVPYILMQYKVPSLAFLKNNFQSSKGEASTSKEVYALALLATVLGEGEGSIVQRKIVRGDQMASRVLVYYNFLSRLQNMFVFAGVPTEKKSVIDVEIAIRDVIADLKSKPISIAELGRARAQLIADTIYNQDSLFTQGMIYGILASVGLPLSTEQDFLSVINTITAKELQTVAQKYLVDDALTVAVLEPQALAFASSSLPASLEEGIQHAR